VTFKLMVIDDRPSRKAVYDKVLSKDLFEPIFVWTLNEFERQRETPVDGYLLDVFLDQGDWDQANAASLLKDAIQAAPRLAPVFLVSQHWGDAKVLDVLKQAGESSVSIVQYLAWGEFEVACGDDKAAPERLAALQTKLQSELSRWHGRSGFRPKPDDTIRVLLLADPQFGDPNTDPKATFAENWIAKTLRSANKSEGLGLPDLIVVAGDVSHSGRPDQFALAEERLAHDLIAPLWGSNNIDRMRDRLIIVPGNHDVNLRFSAADGVYFSPSTKGFKEDSQILVDDGGMPYPSHKEYALEPFRRFAHRLTTQREWLDSKSLSWVDRRFIHCGIRFFVLNTVSDLDATSPDHASLSERDTRAINRSLADDEPASIFSIAVSHHALLPDGATNEKGIDNWLTVGRDFFAMHKIRMWLYGHYHAFGARSLNDSPFEDEPLWMVQIPTTRIYPSTRGFCVLELVRKDAVVVDAFIHPYVLENGKTEKRNSRRIYG
jgi:hypothetical protein